jgi:hypothetical protein
MLEYALIAALGWLTFDQATEIGALEQANKQFSQTIKDNNTALEQCYENIRDKEEAEVAYNTSVREIASHARDTLLELERLRDSSPDLLTFAECSLPDEVWDRINPTSEYGL